MNEYERALELKEETIANRRFLHENAETGLHLPETKAFVMKKLKWKRKTKHVKLHLKK